LTVNSKEENSSDFCPNYVQEFGLCITRHRGGHRGSNSFTIQRLGRQRDREGQRDFFKQGLEGAEERGRRNIEEYKRGERGNGGGRKEDWGKEGRF